MVGAVKAAAGFGGEEESSFFLPFVFNITHKCDGGVEGLVNLILIPSLVDLGLVFSVPNSSL